MMYGKNLTRMYKRYKRYYQFFILPILLLFCMVDIFHLSDSYAEEVDGIVVQFHSVPSPASLGFIMAREKGLYHEAGLPSVKFLWKSESFNYFQPLVDGKVTFATTWLAEGICARANGQPVVSINQTVQASTASLIVRNDLNPSFTRPEDLEGHKIGLWLHCDKTIRAFLAKRKIDFVPVIQCQDTDLLFRLGHIDALQVSGDHELFFMRYLRFRKQVRFFRLSDYNAAYPEDALFCQEEFLKAHPELCRKFIEASYRGWELAIKNPKAATELLCNYCKRKKVMSDPFIIYEQILRWKDIVKFNSILTKNGHCSQEKYDLLCNDLMTAGLINEKNRPRFEDMVYHVLNPGITQSLLSKQKADKKSEKISCPK